MTLEEPETKERNPGPETAKRTPELNPGRVPPASTTDTHLTAPPGLSGASS